MTPLTEEQWNGRLDIRDVLEASTYPPRRLLPVYPTDRKLRLYAIACVRYARWPTPSDIVREVVLLTETFADAKTNSERATIKQARELAKPVDGFDDKILIRLLEKSSAGSAFAVYRQLMGSGSPTDPDPDRGYEARLGLLRDILGNPFRPVVFAPSWRSSSAVALAASMYAARDFGPMPVLADALEEAGCDHADVLAHCRDPAGVHVRGCWVVDGVLGKV